MEIEPPEDDNDPEPANDVVDEPVENPEAETESGVEP